MRSFVVALAALILLPVGLWAEEIRGQIKSVDATTSQVRIMVDGKERTLKCIQNCPVSMTTQVATRRLIRRSTTTQEMIGTISSLYQGAQVTMTTNDSDMVTQIRMQGIQTQSSQTASMDTGGSRFGGRLRARFR